MRKLSTTGIYWLWVSVLVLVIDRLTKLWVVEHLNPLEPLTILSFFNLTLAHNKGAAFSMLHTASGWQNFVLGSVAVVTGLVIVIWMYTLEARERWMNISLSLILGGALGNAWDRYIYGYVIDFFDFHIGNWHFAIFNVADCAISVGTFILICLWLWYPKKIEY